MVDESADEVSTRVAEAPASESATGPNESAQPSPGGRLGRYVVAEELGKGGMGRVYRAHDPKLDRDVAVKVLRWERADSKSRARLLREAQAMAQLSHPNVLPVYDVDAIGDEIYIAMELVEGPTLKTWRTQSHPSWQRMLSALIDSGRGLAAAHAAGLVHRDFKPANVLLGLGPDGVPGRARVLDFGLARGRKLDSSAEVSESSGASRSGSSHLMSADLTETGWLMGTPGYMAPEQHRGSVATAQSDQYAFCIAAYEMLYGERPFSGKLRELTDLKHDGQVPPPPRGSSVPRVVFRVLERGLSPRPADRYESMEALMRDLERPVRSRWGRVAVAGSFVGVAAVTVAVALPRAPTCEGFEDRWAGVWTPERSAELRSGLEGSTVAESAFDRIDAALTEYGTTWVASATAACETGYEGSSAGDLQDRRMSCFDRSLRDVVAFADIVAATNDAPTLVRSLEAIDALPPIGNCQDPERLLAAVAPPTDPALVSAVEQVRSRVADGQALYFAGRIEEADEIGQQLQAEVDELRYVPVVAEVALLRGSVATDMGRFEEAGNELERAYYAAVSANHHEIAARAAAQLVYVVGDRLARPDDGLEWGRHARTQLETAHLGPRQEAILCGLEGVILQNLDRADEAMTLYRRAVELAEASVGKEHPDYATLLVRLGNGLQRDGKYREALVHFESALKIYEVAYGPVHPLVANAHHSIGVIHDDLGHYDEATVAYQRALEIREQVFVPDHPEIAACHNNLGIVYEVRGQFEEAYEAHRQALAIRERSMGADHPLTAQSMFNLANVHLRQDQHEEALRRFAAVRAIYEKHHGTDDIRVGAVLMNSSVPLRELGRYDEARSNLRRVLAIYRKSYGDEHREVGLVLYNLGAVELAKKDLEKALDYLQQALVIQIKAVGEQHPATASMRQAVASVLLDLERPDDARPHLETAYVTVEALDADPIMKANVAFDLARVSEPARARELALEAREGFQRDADRAGGRLRAVEEWLAAHPGDSG